VCSENRSVDCSKVFEDGDVEYVYQGPSTDMRKHKELQDQGKKINLSLSEMAQVRVAYSLLPGPGTTIG
jgi:hypothetical protein